MSFLKEFRQFAFKGNVMDMAVGIVTGGAVAAIIKSFLQNIVTPFIACIFQVPNMTYLTMSLGTSADGEIIELHYGVFIQNSLDFIILAFVIFIALKIANKWMIRAEEESDQEKKNKPSEEVALLTDIRNSLETLSSNKVDNNGSSS